MSKASDGTVWVRVENPKKKRAERRTSKGKRRAGGTTRRRRRRNPGMPGPVLGLLAGLGGAVAGAGLGYASNAALAGQSPTVRGSVTAGVGLVAGGLTALWSPPAGAGIAGGALAVGGVQVIESVRANAALKAATEGVTAGRLVAMPAPARQLPAAARVPMVGAPAARPMGAVGSMGALVNLVRSERRA